MNEELMLKVVELKDGRIGKIIGDLYSGELILESGKGGQVSYFTKGDILKVRR